MNYNKLAVGKGDVVTVLCHTMNPYIHIMKKYPIMERDGG